MTRRAARRRSCSFDTVAALGLALPDVETATRYDGAAILRMRGCFMAGMATHRSTEPGTLVVRTGLEERECLLEEAPETYYLTGHYQKHPVFLVRLSRIDPDALRDLLAVSWRLTAAKKPSRGSRGAPRS